MSEPTCSDPAGCGIDHYHLAPAIPVGIQPEVPSKSEPENLDAVSDDASPVASLGVQPAERAVGRLPEAVAKLEEQAAHYAEDATAFEQYGFPNGLRQREAKARATAALLRAIAEHVPDRSCDPAEHVTYAAASALAAAVLGLPGP